MIDDKYGQKPRTTVGKFGFSYSQGWVNSVIFGMKSDGSRCPPNLAVRKFTNTLLMTSRLRKLMAESDGPR